MTTAGEPRRPPLRVAWYTPWGPDSAIGHYSAAAVAALATHTPLAVTILAGDVDDPSVGLAPPGAGLEHPRAGLPPTVPIWGLGRWPTIPAFADHFDLAIYNMGNHAGYHGAIHERMIRQPGVVILHDLVLRDFYFGQTLEGPGRDTALYLAYAAHSDGPPGAAKAVDLLAGRRREQLDSPDRLDTPMTRGALMAATGVIVHSRYAAQRVAPMTATPVATVDFPPFATARLMAAQPPQRPPATGQGPLRLITFGHLGANRRIDTVLAALAQLPKALADRVVYDVIGSIGEGYRATLREQIASLGLTDRVSLRGPLAEPDLIAALTAADLAINLRDPHTGESSSSLLNQLFAGLPTVVSDHGSYAELPREAVLKVPPGVSAPLLAQTLGAVLADDQRRRGLSQAARDFALRTFCAQRYALAVADFAVGVTPTYPGWQLTDTIAGHLRELDIGPDHPLTLHLARQLAVIMPAAGYPLAPKPPL